MKILISFKDRTRVKKSLEKKITAQLIMIKEKAFFLFYLFSTPAWGVINTGKLIKSKILN